MSISLSNTCNIHSNNSIICAITSSSYMAKLRRLKIEESVLLQSINNSTSIYDHDNCEVDPMNYSILSEFKTFFDDTRKSFNIIKQLYQDIKASTSSKEVLLALDIDDIKKTTLELENNIKSFKIHIQKELTALKTNERQLNQKLEDPVSVRYLKRKPNIPTAKYTEIVPSPVKTLMTSPLKSSEVHEFQEFMRTSKNRYGGWDEYHHNIFVNIWQKHFDAQFIHESDLITDKALEFNLFRRELLPKLLGINDEEVILHVKWYTKYLYLRDRQQKAIDKWRSNRKRMKPSNILNDKKLQNDSSVVKKNVTKKKYPCASRSDENHQAPGDLDQKHDLLLENSEPRISVKFTRKCMIDEMRQDCMQNKEATNNKEYAESYEQAELHFLKSTKQWNIRCGSKNIKNEKEINIENIQKLGIPLWRAGL